MLRDRTFPEETSPQRREFEQNSPGTSTRCHSLTHPCSPRKKTPERSRGQHGHGPGRERAPPLGTLLITLPTRPGSLPWSPPSHPPATPESPSGHARVTPPAPFRQITARDTAPSKQTTTSSSRRAWGTGTGRGHRTAAQARQARVPPPRSSDPRHSLTCSCPRHHPSAGASPCPAGRSRVPGPGRRALGADPARLRQGARPRRAPPRPRAARF